MSFNIGDILVCKPNSNSGTHYYFVHVGRITPSGQLIGHTIKAERSQQNFDGLGGSEIVKPSLPVEELCEIRLRPKKGEEDMYVLQGRDTCVHLYDTNTVLEIKAIKSISRLIKSEKRDIELFELYLLGKGVYTNSCSIHSYTFRNLYRQFILPQQRPIWHFSANDANFIEKTRGKTVAPNKAYVEIKGFIFSIGASAAIDEGTIALSNPLRVLLNLTLGESVTVTSFRTKDPNIYLESICLSVDFLAKDKKEGTFDVKDIHSSLKTTFANQFFVQGQSFIADVKGATLVFSVLQVEVAQLSTLAKHNHSDTKASSSTTSPIRGCLCPNTQMRFERAPAATLRLEGNDSMETGKIFKPNFDFSSMGIGGVDEQFENIFRRAFAPRIAPPAILTKMGIKPVKGLLLYGPPGTGKTLMARQIGQMLNGKEPIVVNGPEILEKYVGESEKKVRELFAPAEEEWKIRGPESDLHVIVLDELDAICKQRGKSNTGGTGVGDTVVNQFLAKMDGYAQQNNILIIGMTNRKELIDEALLRPGRLEVHIEIGLPNEVGRFQILKIHTATMAKSGVLDSSVSLENLAAATKNFSGAELMGLVQNASTYSLNRHIDISDPSHPLDLESIRVTQDDFTRALNEIKPSFGIAEQNLSKCIPNGIWNYGTDFTHLVQQCNIFIEQVRTSARTSLMSVLLEGEVGCGKTALAAHLALQSAFPYVKIISPEDFVGYSEINKLNAINDIFENSYRSPLSIIIVDDIERLLEYVRVGPRFSNTVLQGLLVLLKKTPPPGHKLLILGTSSTRKILEELEFMQVFDTARPYRFWLD